MVTFITLIPYSMFKKKAHFFGKSLDSDLYPDIFAYYPMDGNVNDIVGGYNATTVTNVTFTDDAISGDALFTNTGSRVQVPNNDVFTFTDGVNDKPFSISFWINIFVYSGTQIFISKANSSSLREFIVFYSGNSMIFRLYSGSSSIYIGKQFTITQGDFQYNYNHITITYDGSKTLVGIKMYLNGVEATTTSGTSGTYTGIPNTGSALSIGYLPVLNLEYRGRLDGVAFSNKKLSVTEVLERYLYQSAGNELIV